MSGRTASSLAASDQMEARVMLSPGHTLSSVTYAIGNSHQS